MTKGRSDTKSCLFITPSLFLSIASAVLYILSFPNFNLSCLAWVSLVPLILSLRLFVPSSPRQSFLLGWLSGTVAYAGILYWLIPTFLAAHQPLGLALLCLLLLAGYLGLYWGAWAWVLQHIDSRDSKGSKLKTKEGSSSLFDLLPLLSLPSMFRPYAGAAAWVALEYLRTYLFSGFPWALLADSQVKALPLIQIASVTGVYGVSFLVVLANMAIAEWKPKSLAVVALIVGTTYAGGFYRLHHPIAGSPGRAIKVALLQGNIDQYKKWDKVYVTDIQHTYERLAGEAAESKPDMIIWPETSVPGYILQDPPLRDWLLKIVRQSHTNHLIGAPELKDKSAYNSSFSINNECITKGEYDKTHLVPFGEIVPWSGLLGRFISVLNDLGGFTAGHRSPVLNVAGVSMGVNICYEAIFPNLVRQSVKQGAEIIANLTNDAWYMKTAEPYQHWAPNIFRAVENHRWLVRADNTGFSGIIDPNGRVVATSSIFETVVVTGTVHRLTDMTLYTRLGDWFAWLCCLAVGLVFFWAL